MAALGETGSFSLLRGGASISYRDSESFVKAAGYRTITDGHRQNSNYERTNLLARAGTQWHNHLISLLVNHVNLTAQIPSSVDYNTYRDHPEAAAANWLDINGFQTYNKWQGGLTIHSEIDPGWSNRLAFYGIYNDAYESRPFNILDEMTRTIGLRQRILYNRRNISVSVGTELFRESYNWKIFETIEGTRGRLESNNHERRYYFNLFGHFETEFETGTVISGGLNIHRLYYRTKDIETPGGAKQKHHYPLVLSPRLGVNQRVAEGIYLFASAGHGFSAPSPEEALLPDGSINRDLKPEEGINLEGGVRGQLFSGRLELEFTGYQIRISNLLMTRRDAEDVFYGENAGRTLHSGLESRVKYDFSTAGDEKEYSVTIVHTLMDNRFRHFIRDEVDYRDNQLPGLPGSSLSIMLNTSFSNNLSVHATLRHISSQFLDDANTLTYSGHELADLSAIYRPKSAALRGLRIAGGIQNLFNRHHASMVLVNAPSFGTTPPRYYYPGTPRRFFLSLVFDTSYLQMF